MRNNLKVGSHLLYSSRVPLSAKRGLIVKSFAASSNFENNLSGKTAVILTYHVKFWDAFLNLTSGFCFKIYITHITSANVEFHKSDVCRFKCHVAPSWKLRKGRCIFPDDLASELRCNWENQKSGGESINIGRLGSIHTVGIGKLG